MRELTEAEDTRIWDAVDSKLAFAPSVSAFPGFFAPPPFRVYAMMGDHYDEAVLDAFTARANEWLRAVANPDEELFWLDWQHRCYAFLPHRETVSVYPDGDYCLVVPADLSWGMLGHPWENTITFFGAALCALVDRERPPFLTRLLRSA